MGKLSKTTALSFLKTHTTASPETGCWIPVSTNPFVTNTHKRFSLVHLSYILTSGAEPYRFRQEIVRRCGDVRCVNPAHLIFNEIDRFWFFVNQTTKTACWNWTRGVDVGGYGVFVSHKYGPEKAHRIAYLETVGEIPVGMCVLHHCDNPPCCNPNHLFLGTNQDNVDDKVQKDRQHHPLGVLNGRARVDEDVVKQIRNDHAVEGFSYRQLVMKYGLSQTQIGRIIKKESWAWVF